jgi:hypothetical protein
MTADIVGKIAADVAAQASKSKTDGAAVAVSLWKG